MARWWWRRRSREPVEDEPAPGSAPRVDPATIIDRYTGARPIGQGGATQPPGRGTGAATARLRMPPRAAEAGELPTERTAALADVVLPPGRRRGRRAAALWAADAPTPASPAAWRALASAFEHTGLWPVLLDDAAPGDGWVDQLAPSPPAPPVEVGAVAAHLAAAVRAWSEELTPDLASTDPDYHGELVALLATDAAAGRPASATGRRPDAIAHASAALDSAHLGIVACTRPAQVLERIAWPGARDALDPALLTAVLASWEGRYGALVLGLSADVVTFAVTRPPATIEEAREAAAEQLAACPALTEHWDGFDAHAAALVDAPAWRLRWRDTVGDNRQERAHT